MQFLLDHIASILVSGAVLLLVIATNLNAQRAAIEETVAYAAKVQTLNLADFLEDDLLLVGDGTDDTIETIETNDDGQTTEFSFWREDEMGVDMLVSYTLEEGDVVDVDGEKVQLYRLFRTEDDAAAGGGSSTLQAFSITMLDESGSTTGSVESARLLRVRAINVYGMGDADDMDLFRSYWGITVRPPALDS